MERCSPTLVPKRTLCRLHEMIFIVYFDYLDDASRDQVSMSTRVFTDPISCRLLKWKPATWQSSPSVRNMTNKTIKQRSVPLSLSLFSFYKSSGVGKRYSGSKKYQSVSLVRTQTKHVESRRSYLTELHGVWVRHCRPQTSLTSLTRETDVTLALIFHINHQIWESICYYVTVHWCVVRGHLLNTYNSL